jgi:hypothetical protein
MCVCVWRILGLVRVEYILFSHFSDSRFVFIPVVTSIHFLTCAPTSASSVSVYSYSYSYHLISYLVSVVVLLPDLLIACKRLLQTGSFLKSLLRPPLSLLPLQFSIVQGAFHPRPTPLVDHS